MPPGDPGVYSPPGLVTLPEEKIRFCRFSKKAKGTLRVSVCLLRGLGGVVFISLADKGLKLKEQLSF